MTRCEGCKHCQLCCSICCYLVQPCPAILACILTQNHVSAAVSVCHSFELGGSSQASRCQMCWCHACPTRTNLVPFPERSVSKIIGHSGTGIGDCMSRPSSEHASTSVQPPVQALPLRAQWLHQAVQAKHAHLISFLHSFLQLDSPEQLVRRLNTVRSSMRFSLVQIKQTKAASWRSRKWRAL